MRLIIRDDNIAASRYTAQYIIGKLTPHHSNALPTRNSLPLSRPHHQIRTNILSPIRPRSPHRKQSHPHLCRTSSSTSRWRHILQTCHNIQHGLSALISIAIEIICSCVLRTNTSISPAPTQRATTPSCSSTSSHISIFSHATSIFWMVMRPILKLNAKHMSRKFGRLAALSCS